MATVAADRTGTRGLAEGGGGVAAVAQGGVVADHRLDLADGEIEGGGGGHPRQGSGLAGGGLPGDGPDDVAAGVVDVIAVFAALVVAVIIRRPLEHIRTP